MILWKVLDSKYTIFPKILHDTFVMESWQLVNLVTNFLYKNQDIDWNFLKCIGWPGMIMNQKECG